MLARNVRRRAWTLAVSAVSAVALVGASGVAPADAAASSVASGTATIFMSKAYINNMADNNIVITAQRPISVISTPPTFTITTWTLLGGNPDLSACTGDVYFNAASLINNVASGQSLLLDDITFDLATDSLEYTVHHADGTNTVLIGLQLGGLQWGYVHGTTVTYDATALYVNRAAAAKMDSILDTSAFVDTNAFGFFSMSFQLAQPAAHDGFFTCAQ